MCDTIRVFSFVGSLAGERSHTKRASDMLAEAVRKKAAKAGVNVSYECITADQVRIDYCRSCQSCFKRGICPLDLNDDMGMIKRRLLDADIIFFCTPVYLWEMSGISKSVIDRISYWTHRLELAGKAGVTIASTDNSTAPDFDERFRDLLGLTGLAVVDGLTVRNFGSPNLGDAGDMETLMGETAEKLLDAVHDPMQYITQMQESQWGSVALNTRMMLRLKEIIGIEPEWEETKVCMERGLAECSSLSEYIGTLSKRRRKK